MNKKKISKIALAGILNGLILSGQGAFAVEKAAEKKDTTDYAAQNSSYHLMTEEELLSQLNESGKKTYESLDAEGKKLAREVASQLCNGTNECKGLGACESEKHDCAGQNDCKGQGKCAIGNKNVAVRLVAKKMAEKRAEAAKQKQHK